MKLKHFTQLAKNTQKHSFFSTPRMGGAYGNMARGNATPGVWGVELWVGGYKRGAHFEFKLKLDTQRECTNQSVKTQGRKELKTSSFCFLLPRECTACPICSTTFSHG